MPASSQASSALSTASFTHVSSALRGLSKPSRWRFFVKNSETEMSRWRAPISTAVTVGAGLATGGFAGAAAAVVAGAGVAARVAAADPRLGAADARLGAADDLVFAV